MDIASCILGKMVKMANKQNNKKKICPKCKQNHQDKTKICSNCLEQIKVRRIRDNPIDFKTYEQNKLIEKYKFYSIKESMRR